VTPVCEAEYAVEALLLAAMLAAGVVSSQPRLVTQRVTRPSSAWGSKFRAPV
jgi:hypothetical protein